MEAQVWITGRVGGEVELRDAASPWATFRMGCTPRLVRGGEWGDEQTIWVTVSCSHRLAEHVRLSLRKGDPVIVGGRLRSRRWVDANGVEHEQLQIRATTVGHDLTAGTSSFYRLKRTPAGEVIEPEEAGAEGTTEAECEPEESGGIDIDVLAAIAAEELEAGMAQAELEDPETELATA